MEKLLQFQKDNWAKVPEAKRKACLAHLRKFIDNKTLDEWKTDPWYQDPYFHHLGGMQVRNRLRGVMKDDELPEVIYPPEYNVNNLPIAVKNWDDFYLGALIELVESHNA